MNQGIRAMAVILTALLGAVSAETLCWAMLARASATPRHARATIGTASLFVLAVTMLIGLSDLDMPGRLLVAGGSVLGYAYIRVRINVPTRLARLASHLAGRGLPAAAAPPWAACPTCAESAIFCNCPADASS